MISKEVSAIKVPAPFSKMVLSVISTFDAVPRAFALAIGAYMFSLGLLILRFFFKAALHAISILLFYIIFRNIKPI